MSKSRPPDKVFTTPEGVTSRWTVNLCVYIYLYLFRRPSGRGIDPAEDKASHQQKLFSGT